MLEVTAAHELRKQLATFIGPAARAARNRLGLTQAEVA